MPCNNPSHAHVWPTEGVLVIERCEVYCGFCAGAKTRIWHKHAWFLRRHVEGHVKHEYPGLLVDAGWDPMNPRGIGFNEHREIKKQEKASTSPGNKKKQQQQPRRKQKKQRSKKAGRALSSTPSDHSKGNVSNTVTDFSASATASAVRPSYATEAQTPLSNVGTLQALNGFRNQMACPDSDIEQSSHGCHTRTSLATVGSNLNAPQEPAIATMAASTTSNATQNPSIDMDTCNFLAAGIEWNDPIWDDVETMSIPESTSRNDMAFGSNDTASSHTMPSVEDVIAYLEQVSTGTISASHMSLEMRNQILAIMGNVEISKVLLKSSSRDLAKAKNQHKAVNALANRMTDTSMNTSPGSQVDHVSDNLCRSGVKRHRGFSVMDLTRAKAFKDKLPGKAAVKTSRAAKKASHPQVVSSQVPPFKMTYHNGIAYMNGAAVVKRERCDSLVSTTGTTDQSRFVDTTDDTYLIETIDSVALGRNCAAPHGGNIITAKLATGAAALLGDLQDDNSAASTRSRAHTDQKQAWQDLNMTSAEDRDFVDVSLPSLSASYLSAQGTHTSASLGKAIKSPTDTDQSLIDPRLTEFEKLLAQAGMPSCGEMDTSYAAANEGTETGTFEAQAYSDIRDFVNPSDLDKFAANGAGYVNSVESKEAQLSSLIDFNTLNSPSTLVFEDFSLAGKEADQHNGSSAFRADLVDEASTLDDPYPPLCAMNIDDVAIALDDFVDFGLDGNFTVDNAPDYQAADSTNIQPAVEAKMHGQSTPSSLGPEAAFCTNAQDAVLAGINPGSDLDSSP